MGLCETRRTRRSWAISVCDHILQESILGLRINRIVLSLMCFVDAMRRQVNISRETANTFGGLADSGLQMQSAL